MQTTEFLIVGAGATGLYLARTLAARGLSVVVCETGFEAHDPASQALNEIVVKGRPHRGAEIGRARVLGGTTSLWGGQLTRFTDLDFRPRQWLSLPGWPTTLADIEPYYDLVENDLGLNPVTASDEEIFRGRSPNFQLGPDLTPLYTRWVKRPNFASTFGREVRESPNARIITGATVVDLGFDRDHKSALTATARRLNGLEIRIQAKTIILCAGTIENVRLLLNTARLNSSVPWSKNRNLGRYFQDHLDYRVGAVTILDNRKFRSIFSNFMLHGEKLQPKIRLSDRAQKKELSLNVAGSVKFRSMFGEDLQGLKHLVRSIRGGSMPRNLMSAPKSILGTAAMWRPLIASYMRNREIYSAGDQGIDFVAHCEQRPTDRSTISLSSRMGHLGVPYAELHWAIDGPEISTMRSLAKATASISHRAGFSLQIGPDLLGKEQTVLDHCTDTMHHCGGVGMSVSSAHGVVSQTGLVHGTNNLYVAGACIFPSSSFANPTLTALAFTRRLADKLCEDRRC